MEVVRQEESTREVPGQQEMLGPGGRGEGAGEHSSGVPQADPDGHGIGFGGTGISSPAVIAELAKPEYPRYSRIRGEEGTVVLEVEITADGKPATVTVIRSSGHPRLDDAAHKAFEKAVFVPAREHGEAVASTKRIAFRFAIEEQGE
jgi:protein TonB